MLRLLPPLLLVGFLLSCSGGKLTYYSDGDVHTRQFLDRIKSERRPKQAHFSVKRNDKGQITHVKHLDGQGNLLGKSSYAYTRKGQLKGHRHTEYFFKGPPRVSRDWSYKQGKLTQKDEKWFTRTRSLEKRLTIYYDQNGQPFLEETWGLGRKIESSTEYYYDYKHRLDKSRRNFFNRDGALRDYWLTLYNDENQITHEEHYFANNDLIAFYRYSYHPVAGYREREEVLEESTGHFVSREFDEYGALLVESIHTRDLVLLKKRVYEYNEKHKPKKVFTYDGSGKLVESAPYRRIINLRSYRTPGL